VIDKLEVLKLLETLLQYKDSEITLLIDDRSIVRFDKDTMCFQYIKNGQMESFQDAATTLLAILRGTLC
jgi:hypothetical protein